MADNLPQKNLFRTHLTRDFTTLPNALLRDRSLSFKARGMMALIFTNRDTWEVYQGWLTEQGTEGREAIASGMKELEAAGYAVYNEYRDGGKFKRCVWEFYDTPVAPELRTNRTNHRDTANRATANPQDGKPCHGIPCHGNPATKKDHQEEKSSEERLSDFSLFPAETVEKPAPPKPAARPKQTDEEWMAELRQNPAYAHINFVIEIGKMKAFLTLPQNGNRQMTRRFILNWLNRVEAPVAPPVPAPTKTKAAAL